MLVLSRKTNESLVIAGDIRVKVIEIKGGSVRLGIEAPAEIPVHRAELLARIQASAIAAPHAAPVPAAMAQASH